MQPLSKYFIMKHKIEVEIHIHRGSPLATAIFEILSTVFNLQKIPLTQPEFARLQCCCWGYSFWWRIYILDFLMTAFSVAGAWMSCCGWDSGSCNWMSACHESTLLLIFPIKLLLESCQVPTALVPSLQPPPIPFLPDQAKMPVF